jgi:hypothetical protein
MTSQLTPGFIPIPNSGNHGFDNRYNTASGSHSEEKYIIDNSVF